MFRELDAEVAEKVMGWRDVGMESNRDHTEYVNHGCPPSESRRKSVPLYSTDIAAAWEVVEKMHREQLDFTLERCFNTGWAAFFSNIPFGGPKKYEVNAAGEAETAPEAICRAALEAMEAK